MRKETLQKQLLNNIKITGVLYVIITILFVRELYLINIATPSLIVIQSQLIFKDYFIFLLFGTGTVAMGLSVYYYFLLPTLSYKAQVFILIFTGILLLPFSLILLIIGNMIMIERPKTKNVGFYTIIVTMFVFLTIYSLTLVRFAEHKPTYTQSKVYEFEYRLSEEVIKFDMEVVYKDGEWLYTDLSSISTIRNTDLVFPNSEYLSYHLSINSRVSCYQLVTTDSITDQEDSCQMTPEFYPNMTLAAFLDFETFSVVNAVYLDQDGLFPVILEGELVLINEYEKDNYYE